MNPQPFKPRAYLKEGCPFSFKYLLFMAEAGLIDQIEVIRCDPDDEAFEETKAKLAAATNKPATFPTVEIEPGVYQSDSDELIARYAGKHRVDTQKLPALSFYKDGILPQVVQLHQEHKDG